MWRIAVFILLWLPASFAQAAASGWISSQGGDVRLVAGAPDASGTIQAILQIRLKDGWKTYWIDPGESGIPPQVTAQDTGNTTISEVRFPAPKRFDDGVVRYFGYDEPVAFPLTLKSTGTSASIRLSVFLGICKDICIPVQGELSLDLKPGEEASPLEKVAIRRAGSALPEQPSADFTLQSADFDAATSRVRVVLTIPEISDGSPPDLFVTGAGAVRFGAPENVSVTGTQLTADLPVLSENGKQAPSAGTAMLVTVAGGRSMQTTLAFK
ncbi:protein-disulfide reductase DsbD domain-containing protein [Pararhizobium sp.]|uniref:protein-disulfide reductase DsbD domain-containing protein n=1 Tax=Pararhizobium sp. TaxID=1977563 RepID=UPI0027216373|nr:protein-disulfide reductase DsbD domain-containing protein [Pararhizobium sp.]MDO9415776.1 protein-disulfide reductase DsbD family protein [Pararhizobium sp.]